MTNQTTDKRFFKENAITVEERRIFVDTGAGDTLEMICGIPDEQDGEEDTLHYQRGETNKKIIRTLHGIIVNIATES